MATLIFFFLVFSAVAHEPSLISAHKPTTSSPCHPDHTDVDASDSGTIELPERQFGNQRLQRATVVAGCNSQSPNLNPESPPDVQINGPPPTCSIASTSTGPTISHTVPSGSGMTNNEISIDINTNPTGQEARAVGIYTGSTDPGTSNRESSFFRNLLARANMATAGDHVNDDQGLFKLVKDFMNLAFQAAIALMIFRLNPLGGNSSPSSPSPSPSSSSSSFLSTMGGETILFCFTSCMIAIILRQLHPTVAYIFGYLGILSGALGFFLMMETYMPDHYVCSVWTAASLLLVVFGYSLARRSQ